MRPACDILENPAVWRVVAEGPDGLSVVLRSPKAIALWVIASWGMGWDHVSVSLCERCPSWTEMAFVKDVFFHDEECVMQLHPPKSRYVDCHPYCLHLWRPQASEIPQPPPELVGPRPCTGKRAAVLALLLAGTMGFPCNPEPGT